MLSKKIMQATEAACQSVCMAEEGAAHYGEPYTLWNRWTAWWQGFFAGWGNETGHYVFMPLKDRLVQSFRKHQDRWTTNRRIRKSSSLR